MIDLYKNTIDIDYMRKIIRMSERYPERRLDLWDSISENQFISKTELLQTVLESDILHKDLSVMIIGSWYGSILIPVLAPLVKEIQCFDIDETTTHIASNLHEYDNVTYSSQDLTNDAKRYKGFSPDNDLLIINTSCEHMGSMKELLENQKVKETNKKVFFAFQSNNMYGIEGHINCKDTIEDFKKDLPNRCFLFKQQEIEEERGTRFFLFGRLPPKDPSVRADGTYHRNLEEREEHSPRHDIRLKKGYKKK